MGKAARKKVSFKAGVKTKTISKKGVGAAGAKFQNVMKTHPVIKVGGSW